MRLVTMLAMLVLGAPALATPAAEQHEGGRLDEETLLRAESLFFEGLSHYRAKRFEQAALAFQEVYSLTGHRDLLYNVARSRENLGHKEGALEWYQRYLDTAPVDETAVIQRMRALGGAPRPAGQARTKVLPKRKAAPSSVPQQSGAGVWPWLALGAGAVAAGAGAWLGLQALDDASAAREANRRSKAESFKTSAQSTALLADVSFGVGAAAVGAAFYLWWSADGQAPVKGRVTIDARADQLGLGWAGRF